MIFINWNYSFEIDFVFSIYKVKLELYVFIYRGLTLQNVTVAFEITVFQRTKVKFQQIQKEILSLFYFVFPVYNKDNIDRERCLYTGITL